MSTISEAKIVDKSICVCQGDIFKNVSYALGVPKPNESNEYIFPFAVIVSQACDVISMSDLAESKSGKATKIMPSIFLCPIYDEKAVKSGAHLDCFTESYNIEERYNVYTKKHQNIANIDWHYRFHCFSIQNDDVLIEKSLIDFKHYFTVSIEYLLDNRENRVCRLEPIFAEQVTLKFATYLSRVAIP